LVDKTDAFSSLRAFLEELIAPSIRTVQEHVRFVGERGATTSEEVQELRGQMREMLQFMNSELASLKERVGRLEGRSEGLKSELTAVLESEMLKALHGSRMKALPLSSEGGGDSP
jgi:hypothetical protein